MSKLVTVTLCCILLIGCSKKEDREIPTSDPKPSLAAWVPVRGVSMQPVYPNGTLVEVEFGVSYESLVKGQRVILWDYQRGAKTFTFHELAYKQGDQWVTKGLNPETNKKYDGPWTTKDNFYGVATGRHTQTLLAPPPLTYD